MASGVVTAYQFHEERTLTGTRSRSASEIARASLSKEASGSESSHSTSRMMPLPPISDYREPLFQMFVPTMPRLMRPKVQYPPAPQHEVPALIFDEPNR